MSTVRYGSVLKFREGVTRQEAAEALLRIRDVLDLPMGGTWEPPAGWDFERDGACPMRYGSERRTTLLDHVHEYDPRDGSPVWYIP